MPALTACQRHVWRHQQHRDNHDAHDHKKLNQEEHQCNSNDGFHAYLPHPTGAGKTPGIPTGAAFSPLIGRGKGELEDFLMLKFKRCQQGRWDWNARAGHDKGRGQAKLIPIPIWPLRRPPAASPSAAWKRCAFPHSGAREPVWTVARFTYLDWTGVMPAMPLTIGTCIAGLV